MTRRSTRELDDYEDSDHEEAGEPAPTALAWIRNMPAWAISAVLHLVLILILLNVVRHTEKKVESETTITVAVSPLSQEKPKPPPYDPTKKRAMEAKPKVPGPKDQTDKPIVRKTDKVDEVATDIPKGTSLENVTDFNTDFSGSGTQTGTNIAMGVGGGVAGAYGQRWGKGSLVREGGSDGSESAVRAALEWLRRHQSPDGRWSSAGYLKQCKTECRSVDSERYGEDKAFPEHDVGVTGLAMLAMTGYGQTHVSGDYPEYVDCLSKAVKFMKKQQIRSSDPNTDGRYGSGDHEQWIYDHAIATMAMAELLVMSNDLIGLKQSVKSAVQLILRAQNDGLGWRYGVKPIESDSSVTGWMVLALKTAKNARLGIPKSEFDRAFAGALNWFDRVTAANGKCGYMVLGDEGSRLAKGHPDPYPFSKELSCMTAVSVLCRIFGGESRQTENIRNGVKILMAEPPLWQEQKGRLLSKVNMYYWYYGTYALFQFGGKEWKEWNEHMQTALIKTQRQGNIDEDGSWDPIDEWGIAGGRVYMTALGAMTLEVYYRFLRAESGVGF